MKPDSIVLGSGDRSKILTTDLDKIVPLLEASGNHKNDDGYRPCVVCGTDSAMKITKVPNDYAELSCNEHCTSAGIAKKIWETVAPEFPLEPASKDVAVADGRDKMDDYQLNFAVHTCPRVILNAARKFILRSILTKGNGSYISFTELEDYSGLSKRPLQDNVRWLEDSGWLEIEHGDRNTANR
jgi:hypothetical protein